jgi:allantoinase
MSQKPAEIFSVYGQKGRIEPGFDADFTIIDPNEEWEVTEQELKYVNKISAFVGQKGKGRPVFTIVRGQIVCEQDHILLHSHGRWITKTKA